MGIQLQMLTSLSPIHVEPPVAGEHAIIDDTEFGRLSIFYKWVSFPAFATNMALSGKQEPVLIVLFAS